MTNRGPRGYFTETGAFGLGAALMLQDEQGRVGTRLKDGEVMAFDKVITSQVYVTDAEGFAATLGVTDLPRFGRDGNWSHQAHEKRTRHPRLLSSCLTRTRM